MNVRLTEAYIRHRLLLRLMLKLSAGCGGRKAHGHSPASPPLPLGRELFSAQSQQIKLLLVVCVTKGSLYCNLSTLGLMQLYPRLNSARSAAVLRSLPSVISLSYWICAVAGAARQTPVTMETQT